MPLHSIPVCSPALSFPKLGNYGTVPSELVGFYADFFITYVIGLQELSVICTWRSWETQENRETSINKKRKEEVGKRRKEKEEMGAWEIYRTVVFL